MAYLPGMGAPQPNWLGMLGQNLQQFKTPSAMMPIMGMLNALQPSMTPRNYGLAVATGGLQGMIQGQQYEQEMKRQEEIKALRELQMQQARSQMARAASQEQRAIEAAQRDRERQTSASEWYQQNLPGMLKDAPVELQQQYAEGMLTPEEEKEPIKVGNVLLDPNTYQPIYQAPQEPTSLMQNLAAAGIKRGTPEYESAMMQGILKPQNQINMGQVPSGYYMNDPANPAAGLTPIPGGPAEKEQKAAERNVDLLEDSVNRYEKLLDKTGAEIVPGKEQSELSTAYTDVMMQLKELWNLGVLQGADFEIMARAITDPTSFRGKAIELFGGVDALKGQLDIVRQKMKAAKESAGMLSGKEAPFTGMMEPGMIKRETNRSDSDILKQYGLE